MQLIATPAMQLACSIVRDYTAMIHESSTRLRFPSLYIFSFCGWLPFFDAYTKSISSPGMIGLGSFSHLTELQEGWLRKSLDSGRFCIRWIQCGWRGERILRQTARNGSSDGPANEYDYEKGGCCCSVGVSEALATAGVRRFIC
jgi:hypothetical protein